MNSEIMSGSLLDPGFASGAYAMAPSGLNYTSVIGRWVIPNCVADDKSWWGLSTWIGLGSGVEVAPGYGVTPADQLCQAGFTVEIFQGRTSVYPWVRWGVDENSLDWGLESFFSPGDTVYCAVCVPAKTDPTADSKPAFFYFLNATTNLFLSLPRTVKAGFNANYAAWIVGDPKLKADKITSAFPQFGMVEFDNLFVVSGAPAGPIPLQSIDYRQVPGIISRGSVSPGADPRIECIYV